MVILGHGMGYTTHLYLNMAIVHAGHYGEVLLHAGINGVHGELLHLLTTAYDGNLRINNFLDYITTMFAFEKFYCHSI